jgi:hypothetical protein
MQQQYTALHAAFIANSAIRKAAQIAHDVRPAEGKKKGKRLALGACDAAPLSSAITFSSATGCKLHLSAALPPQTASLSAS